MSIIYNENMDISDWDNKEIVNVLLAHKKISQKKLIEMLSKERNEDLPQSTFANQLWRNSLRLSEFQQICDVLGYKIILEPKS